MAAVSATLTILLVPILLLACPTSGAKILVVPTSINSHVLFCGKLAVDLAHLGHEVHMLLPSDVKIPVEFENETNSTGNAGTLTTTVYPVGDGEPYIGSSEACELLVKTALSRSVMEKFWLTMEFSMEVYNHLARDCVRLLENRQLMDAVRAAGYQFAIMDPVAIHCHYALPYGADIPFGTLSIPWSTLTYRVPRLPSFYTIFPDIDLSSFTGRLLSFLFEFIDLATAWALTAEYVETYAPDRPVIGALELIRRTSLWFYLEDIAVGKPAPMMPNTIAVGDLMAGRKGSELPSELETFIFRHVGARDDTNSSHNGRAVIVVSFGSFVDYVPDDVIAKFCEAFRRLPVGLAVVWKMKIPDICGASENVDDRIRIMPWIPQNDLLADPRVRLFITHAGLNSIIESVYHGKPIIAFPIGIDQPYNAEMASSKGFGIRMDLGDFDADSLLVAIDTVLTDSKYRQRTERASAIMRDRRQTPGERVSDAIEHVIKYGDQDLRTSAFDLNVLQYIMFDIFAFIFVSIAIICTVSVGICCVVMRRCCGRRKQNKRKTD